MMVFSQRFVRFCLALVTLSVTISCSDVGDTDASIKGSPEKEDSSNAKLVIFNWEEYLAPSVIEQFTEETGIEVDYQTYENTLEMKAQLQSSPGKYDLIISDDVSLRELAELKMIAPLDHSKLTNLSNLQKRFMNLHFDPENAYTIPYLWGTTLIAYRSDLIGDTVPSWGAFFDPEHDMKVALIDEMSDVFGCALLAKGHSLASDNTDEMSEAEILLVDFATSADVVVTDLYDALDSLNHGLLTMTMSYSGDAAAYADENELISYLIPEEGAALWLDSFAVVAEGHRSSAAYQFIDFLLRAEVAAENASELWYATPNEAAIAHLDPEFLEDTAIWPSSEVMLRCAFHPKPSHSRDVAISRVMKSVVQKVRLKTERSTVAGAFDERSGLSND